MIMESFFSDLLCAAISGMSLFLSLFICFDDSYLQTLSIRLAPWRNRKGIIMTVSVLTLVALSVVFDFSAFLCVFCSLALIAAIFYVVNYSAFRQILKRKVFLLDMYCFMVTMIFSLSVFSFLSMSAAAMSCVADASVKLIMLSLICAIEYGIAAMMLFNGDSMFLLPARRRQKIEESILGNNDPKYACGTSFSSSCEAIMKRLISYLENEKAFLNPDLKAGDVAKMIFTNRSYLAKTIKIHKKGNFSQLVNKYRVEYSISLFNHNPRLTVAELAHMSGFKTTPTYSAAFRMVMDESPVEWCKYRRACLSK